jgi:hypothetical protein
MARTLVSITDITRAGAILADLTTAIVAANGGAFRNSGREWLYVSNASGNTVTITVTIPRTVDGAAVASKTWSLATGKAITIPPFGTDTYNNPNDQVYFSANYNVSVCVYRDDT